MEEVLRVRYPQQVAGERVPFPTLAIAEAVRRVFEIEPSLEQPFNMLLKPEEVIFPQIVKVDAGAFTYFGPHSARSRRRFLLEQALAGKGVECDSIASSIDDETASNETVEG